MGRLAVRAAACPMDSIADSSPAVTTSDSGGAKTLSGSAAGVEVTSDATSVLTSSSSAGGKVGAISRCSIDSVADSVVVEVVLLVLVDLGNVCLCSMYL